MNLVWKLLKQHISIPQFVGFFLANLVGMVIILLGVQFFQDTESAYNGKDGVMKEDYIIISKRVSTLGSTIFRQSSAFSKDELEDLQDQSFVEKVGVFTPSAFKVRAGLDMMGMSKMSTDMFFESVPDEFVDTDQKWGYKEGEKFVPIILPRDYMDLYNFGFAQSKNLPKISEGLATSVGLDITISGNGKSDHFNGRIVGFSNRLNTLLVPQAFMDWANKKYAGSDKVEHSRVILQVNNPTDANLAKYLQKNDYQTDSNKLRTSKTAFILRMVLSIVMAVGLIICVLAFYILMLSIFLLIQKNSDKLENLLLLGYSTSQVSRPYQLLTIGLNALVIVLSVGILLFVRSYYIEKMSDFFPQYEAPGIGLTLMVGLGLFLLITLFNNLLIVQKVKNIIKKK